MAEKKKDDLADALAALAAGEHVEDDTGASGTSGVSGHVDLAHGPASAGAPPPQPPVQGRPPAAPRPAPPPPANVKRPAPPTPPTGTAVHRPPAPRPPGSAPVPRPQARPPASAASPAAPPPTKAPPARLRPLTPLGSGNAPMRPAAPGAPPPPVPAPQPAPAEIIDDVEAEPVPDDDAVIVPAPDPSMLGPRAAPQRPARPPLFKTLEFRRTVIPILLTCGVIMIALGVSRWVLGDDSESMLGAVLAETAWLPWVLLLVGALLLGLGVANALHVKHEMQARPAPR